MSLKIFLVSLSCHNIGDPPHCYTVPHVNVSGYHGIELDGLWSKFSWKQKFQYYWRKFFIEWLYTVPIIRQFMSKSCIKVMEKMHKRLKMTPDR